MSVFPPDQDTEGPAERLAAPLWRLASRVLADVPPAETLEAAAAVRAFTEGPSPARYLAATRVLRQTERRHKLRSLGPHRGSAPHRAGARGPRAARGLAPELLEALRALPEDARNGRRLTLISEMLTAHSLIEARTADRRCSSCGGPSAPCHAPRQPIAAGGAARAKRPGLRRHSRIRSRPRGRLATCGTGRVE